MVPQEHEVESKIDEVKFLCMTRLGKILIKTKGEKYMSKIFILLLVFLCGSTCSLLSQEKIKSYSTIGKNGTPNYAEFSIDGKYIAAGVIGAVRIWETNSNEFKDYKTKSKNVTPNFVCFSPDGEFIVAGVYGAVRVWKINSDSFTDYKTKSKNITPNFVCFSPDGEYIVAGNWGEVRTWEIVK